MGVKYMAGEELLAASGFGFLAGMIAFALIIGLIIYIYVAIALMTIANRKKVPNGWLAFIPIANLYLMTQIGGIQWWWMFIFILPIIPAIGGLLYAVGFVYLWWKIAEAVKRPGWWGILMIIPIVNLVMIGVMAWGSD